MRRAFVFISVTALVLVTTGLAAPSAGASGKVEKWVANFTDQCTSPSVCGTEFLGGEWGHGVFVRDDSTGVATGEIDVTFAFHDVQGSGALLATSHLKTHVTQWSVGAGFAGVPNIVFDDYYSTFTGGLGLFFDGPLGGPPVDSEPCFLGCPLYSEIPAVPGHFTLSSFFGIDELPGFTYEATVVKVS
jgi:hypothetical protein